jgi:hypothetical protein
MKVLEQVDDSRPRAGMRPGEGRLFALIEGVVGVGAGGSHQLLSGILKRVVSQLLTYCGPAQLPGSQPAAFFPIGSIG